MQNTIRNPKYKPCSHCEKAGRPGLYHPESECRLKLRNQQKFGNQPINNNDKNIRIANNTELEAILNKELDQKN